MRKRCLWTGEHQTNLKDSVHPHLNLLLDATLSTCGRPGTDLDLSTSRHLISTTTLYIKNSTLELTNLRLREVK